MPFFFFLFLFACFSSSFSSPFCRSPTGSSFFFVLSLFRSFLTSPSSRSFSLPCLFPWWRILFCYFVSARYTPPALFCDPEICVFPLRAAFFLAMLLLFSCHLHERCFALFKQLKEGEKGGCSALFPPRVQTLPLPNK